MTFRKLRRSWINYTALGVAVAVSFILFVTAVFFVFSAIFGAVGQHNYIKNNTANVYGIAYVSQMSYEFTGEDYGSIKCNLTINDIDKDYIYYEYTMNVEVDYDYTICKEDIDQLTEYIEYYSTVYNSYTIYIDDNLIYEGFVITEGSHTVYCEGKHWLSSETRNLISIYKEGYHYDIDYNITISSKVANEYEVYQDNYINYTIVRKDFDTESNSQKTLDTMKIIIYSCLAYLSVFASFEIFLAIASKVEKKKEENKKTQNVVKKEDSDDKAIEI